MAKIEKLLSSIDYWRDNLYINLQVQTGYRFNELIKIKWSDLIDKQGCVLDKIALEISQKGRNRATKEVRTIVFTQRLKTIISRSYYKAHQPNLSRIVFIAQRGNVGLKPITNTGMNKILEKYKLLFKIETMDKGRLTTHGLRKTAAHWFWMNAINQGQSKALKLTQQWMCHKNISTTLMYLGLDQKEIDNITLSMSFDNQGTCLQLLKRGTLEYRGMYEYFQTKDNPEELLREYLISMSDTVDTKDLEESMKWVEVKMLIDKQ